MNLFNSLQSASRGHSQHSVQTDRNRTHTLTHELTHRRQLSITREAGRGEWEHEVAASRAEGEHKDKRNRKHARYMKKGEKDKVGWTEIRRMTNTKKERRTPQLCCVSFCLLLFIPINSASLTISAFDWGRERNWWEIGIDTPPVFPVSSEQWSLVPCRHFNNTQHCCYSAYILLLQNSFFFFFAHLEVNNLDRKREGEEQGAFQWIKEESLYVPKIWNDELQMTFYREMLTLTQQAEHY